MAAGMCKVGSGPIEMALCCARFGLPHQWMVSVGNRALHFAPFPKEREG
ncbi:MAG: hypothetical protein CFH37_00519 [Alphaproteobacteria bacterium MarineAlpha9_Bin7]|nr:MAG: hypothetical protein CFH37_00519 [Alphaproteobacteria bacterium MarineAlpha9_Bin7]